MRENKEMPKWPDFILLSGRAVSVIKNKKMEKILFRNRGNIYLPFFGLTWNEKNIFLGRRSREKYNDVVEIYDNQWNRLSTIPFFFSDLHQIYLVKYKYYPENRIYIVNSETDIIYEWDEHNLYKRFSSEKGDGSYHINSIYCHNNHFWICCHNWASKNNSKSFFLELDDDFNIINRFDYGIDAHNIFVDKNFLYTCSSFENTFNRLNLISRETDSIYLNGFTRGLGVTDKYFLVGSSTNKTHKERISDCDCNVYLIDRSKFDIVDSMTLKSIGLNVDIRELI